MTINNYDIYPGKVTKFDIYNDKTGRSVSAISLIQSLSYYESVVKPAVTMNIVMMETGTSVSKDSKQMNVLDGLPLRGGERVEIEFTDGKNPQNTISFTGNSALRVNVIGNVIQDSTTTLYNIHLCSDEYLTNDTVFVKKCFVGKLSEIVKRVLEEELQTRKRISVDESINAPNVYGHQRHPLNLCCELARTSIPNLPNSKGITAGCFFYETADGYNLKSIDGILANRSRSKKYIYNNTNEYPPGYDGKILTYRPSRTINVKRQLQTGAGGLEVALFSTNTFNTNVNSLNIDNQKTSVNASGRDFAFLPDKFRKTSVKVYGNVDSGQSINGNTTEEKIQNYERNPNTLNFDMPNIIAQGRMRFNQLYTQKFEISLPGDFSLRAGQTLDCTFPSPSFTLNKEKDESISGIYIIESLHHTVTAERQSLTYITLVRDSYSNSP